MYIRKGLMMILLMSLLGGCLSKKDGCLLELEESEIRDSCTIWLIYARDVDNTDPIVLEQINAILSLYGPMCAKYLYDQQQCRDKKGIPTKIY